MKKVFTVLVAISVVLCCAFAEKVSSYSISGVKNINADDITQIVFPYKGKEFTEDAETEILNALYAVDGVDYILTQTVHTENGVKLFYEFVELPMIKKITFNGNEKVKKSDLKNDFKTLEEGTFVELSKTAVLSAVNEEVQDIYKTHGIDDAVCVSEYVLNEADNTVELVCNITEALQRRIVEINILGNDSVAFAAINRNISSYKKGLFHAGYLDRKMIAQDAQNIKAYYQSLGYIDVQVSEPEITELRDNKHGYKEVSVLFKITEGGRWTLGKVEIEGNEVFSDENLLENFTLKTGDILNLSAVQSSFAAIADVYYNNGYIRSSFDLKDERNEEKNIVDYIFTIVEGPISVVEKVNFIGLEKTKEYVFRRELTLKEGDVFSKEKLTTSAQNIYNTGILSDINYDLSMGSKENGVVLDFTVTEGSTMDLQFGATFGGNTTGFPISGFVSWSNKNFLGRGLNLSVSTTLSPTTQSLSTSFGTSWIGNKRLSNTIGIEVSNTLYDDQLRKSPASEQYDGRNEAFPLGYLSYEAWEKAGNRYPADENLMSYNMASLALSDTCGYTWIYDVGRLSVSGGLSFALKHVYGEDDKNYIPFEKVISEYREGWKWSNRLSASVQWDGRDYVLNTTKGYVASLGFTYAGGFLGGLSNYMRANTNVAGYVKLHDFEHQDGTSTPLMFCASNSFSFMLPQYKNGAWRDPKEGTSQVEMLYIDGRTMARGFDVITDQSVLNDTMLEISYQVAPNIVQLEGFVSSTFIRSNLIWDKTAFGTDGFYFAAGIGAKLKISGFPLGLYLVKNAKCISADDYAFKWQKGNVFAGDSVNGGMNLVLAISTSLI